MCWSPSWQIFRSVYFLHCESQFRIMPLIIFLLPKEANNAGPFYGAKLLKVNMPTVLAATNSII